MIIIEDSKFTDMKLMLSTNAVFHFYSSHVNPFTERLPRMLFDNDFIEVVGHVRKFMLHDDALSSRYMRRSLLLLDFNTFIVLYISIWNGFLNRNIHREFTGNEKVVF